MESRQESELADIANLLMDDGENNIVNESYTVDEEIAAEWASEE